MSVPAASQPELGPAMRALPNERWRAFVLNLLGQGKRNATQAAMDAGFEGDNPTLRTTAWRLMRDERVQAALQEEGRKRLRGVMLALALETHEQLLEDPQVEKAVKLKAVQMVYDRAGLHAVSEHKTTVEHIGGDEGVLRKIEMLAKGLGINPAELLGNRVRLEPPTIDVEAVELVEPPAGVTLEDLI